MIALDSSSVIAFFEGEEGADVELVRQAFTSGQAALPPAVLTELLSDPALPADLASRLADLPLLDPGDGFWERAGRLRASVLASGRKARLADTLIAQSCLDHDLALVTRDGDFNIFLRHSTLRLAV